jgi:hypothetical protein
VSRRSKPRDQVGVRIKRRSGDRRSREKPQDPPSKTEGGAPSVGWVVDREIGGPGETQDAPSKTEDGATGRQKIDLEARRKAAGLAKSARPALQGN